MKLKSKIPWILLLSFIPLTIFPLTLKKTSIREMTRSSDLIIQGYVLEKWTGWNETHDLIYTYTRVQINAVYKGEPDGDIITIQQRGGRIGDIEMILHGSPDLQVASEVLLFLKQHGDFYRIHSIALGKFDIIWDSRKGQYIARHSLYGVNLLNPESKEPLPDSEHFSRYPLALILNEVRRASR